MLHLQPGQERRALCAQVLTEFFFVFTTATRYILLTALSLTLIIADGMGIYNTAALRRRTAFGVEFAKHLFIN